MIICPVSTHTSLLFLINGVREPGNLREIKSKTFNIFRLAKERNFRTYFLSAQDAKSTYESGSQYVDKIISKEEHPLLFKKKRDLALLDILNKLPLGERNLVVVQLRVPHAPYAKNYEPGTVYDRFTGLGKRIDSYDNALLFFDEVMSLLFDYFQRLPEGNNYFIFVSDHGQALGENGRFGHNHLDQTAAKVPFLSFNRQGGKISRRRPSHYEIAEWIGQLLGFEFINPNLDPGVGFIHGNNFQTDYEFIRYTKMDGEIRSESVHSVKSLLEGKAR